MTAVANRPSELWGTMPGWGIAANLLPPEIVAARRARTLRKLMTIVVTAVVVLCAAGYAYARWQSHPASAALREEQARTVELQQEQSKYGDVVTMEGSVASVNARIASLLSNDVDVPKLMTALLQQLPAGATVSQLAVTFDTASTSGTNMTTETGGAALDLSGHPHIGTVSLTGHARSLGDVARFVTGLSGLTGVVGVYPSSQQRSTDGVQFTIVLTVTDQVLSHRYSTTTASTTGGN